MKRYTLLLSTVVFFAIVLSIVQISFSAFFITGGMELSQIQTKTQQVEKENMILSEKLYSESSFTTIEASAKQLGFEDEKSTSRITMAGSSAFALKQ